MSDETVPLVVYGPDGERKVIGKAKFVKDDDLAVVSVSAEIDDEEWAKKLQPPGERYSIGEMRNVFSEPAAHPIKEGE